MTPIEFPPGVTTLLSRAAKITNWRDGNLIRWENGATLKPVGGWEEIVLEGTFASRIRAMHRWTALNGIVWTAFICEQHCYVESAGILIDITPTGGISQPPGKNAGYGELDYGENNYGVDVPGAVSTIQKFSLAWSADNWGQNLLVMWSYDGRLFEWKPDTPTVILAPVTGAPIGNRQFVITPERHVMLFGMNGEFGDIGWCSQENINDWDFGSITNTAGAYTVDPLSPIVGARMSAAGVLVFTPAMSHVLDYVALPYIYRIRPIGRVPIPISASSVTSIPDGVVWVSVEGFWIWNGVTADVMPCPLWDTIAGRMDFGRTVYESHVVSIGSRGEVWWFWVDINLGLETSRYAALDYRDKIWMPGMLSRTCGFTYGNDRNPVMSDGYKVWKHEVGFVYPDAVAMPYLESQTLNADGGESWITITKILPDIMGDRTALAFRLALNDDRTVYSAQRYTPQRTVNEHGWVDIRETARDCRLRIEMVRSLNWSTIGPIIFDIKTRGKKK